MEDTERLVIAVTTEANQELAESLACSLLEIRLAACICLSDVQSSYWWNNQIQKSKEVQLFIKTNKKNIHLLRKKILEIHSYEVPEFIYWSASANKSYFEWMEDELLVSN